MPTTDSLADRVKTINEVGKVPGLLFQVKANVLAAHLRDRAGYHKRRAEEKQAEIPDMEKAVSGLRESISKIKGFDKASAVPTFSNKSSASYGFDGSDQAAALESQIEALRQDIKEHTNKSASFAFLAEAVFDAVYALEWADLQRLEVVK